MIFTDRNCPICASNEESYEFIPENFDAANLDQYSYSSRKMPDLMHFRMMCCSKCDVLFASPAPVGDWLAKAYHDAQYDSSEEAFFAALTYGRELQRIVPNLTDMIGALDIGAGDGAFLRVLLSSGFCNVLGVEPSAAPVSMADASVRGLIRQKPFVADDYETGAFSLVSCFQTLEHLDNPLRVCRAICGLIKPGGALFAVVHNHQSFLARLLGARSPIFDVEHLQLFSPTSIRLLLERAGFSRVTVYPLINRYPLRYWIKMLPLGRNAKLRCVATANTLGIGSIPVPLPVGNLAVVAFRD